MYFKKMNSSCFSLNEKTRINWPHRHMATCNAGSECWAFYKAEGRASCIPESIFHQYAGGECQQAFCERLEFRPWVCHFYCIRTNNTKICCDPIRFYEFPFILFFPRGKFHLLFPEGAPSSSSNSIGWCKQICISSHTTARIRNPCITWVSWSAPPEDTNRLPNKIICEPIYASPLIHLSAKIKAERKINDRK